MNNVFISIKPDLKVKIVVDGKEPYWVDFGVLKGVCLSASEIESRILKSRSRLKKDVVEIPVSALESILAKVKAKPERKER